MSFIQQPAYILGVLLVIILTSEWLSTKKFFKHIGAVLLVIIITAIVAAIGIIPSSQNPPPVYDKIFEYAAPLCIFFLVLDVRLKDLKLAGLPMLMMFSIGAVATICGVLLGFYLLSPETHHVNHANVIAGMFTGTYIGGGANLTAVAINYDLQKEGNLYAAVNAVDNIYTTIWMMITLLLPPLFYKYFKGKKNIPKGVHRLSEEKMTKLLSNDKAPISIMDISTLLALGFGSMFLSSVINSYIPKIPSVLILTIFALCLAQIPAIQKIKGAKLLGMFLAMLFLAVIGAYCDIGALINSGDMAGTLLAWDGILMLTHGLIIFFLGWLFRQDWDIIAIASNANIGGATTAPVCAASLGRRDLELPGILAGSLGNAIGSFLGILIAEFLK